MRILGIDPGLVQTGYGLISVKDNDISLLDYGIIKPDVKGIISTRLLTIFEDIKELISSGNPTVFAIEEVFYGKNVRSLLGLGQARGAAILASAELKVPIYEYSPRKIKQSLTGNGNAQKEQVQFMVKNILKMSVLPQPIDASDALAVALCHHQQFRFRDL